MAVQGINNTVSVAFLCPQDCKKGIIKHPRHYKTWWVAQGSDIVNTIACVRFFHPQGNSTVRSLYYNILAEVPGFQFWENIDYKQVPLLIHMNQFWEWPNVIEMPYVVEWEREPRYFHSWVQQLHQNDPVIYLHIRSSHSKSDIS